MNKDFEEIIKEFSKKNITKNQIDSLLIKGGDLLKSEKISYEELRQINELYDKRLKEIEAPIKEAEKKEKEQEEWEKKFIFSPLKKVILIIVGLIIFYAIFSPSSQSPEDFDDSFKQDIQTR